MTKDWKVAAQRGSSLLDAGDHAAALDAYEEAIRDGGDTWALWADVAIAAKQTRHFTRAHEAARRSVEGGAPGGDGVFWNLGIAATAVGAWEDARRAWKACGIPIPDGHGEISLDLGLTPVRLEPGKAKEIVWGQRICPARVVLRSIPIAVPERRHGDVVLHDGQPQGKVADHEGIHRSVFDVLDVLVPSPARTYLAKVVAPDAASFALLRAALAKRGHVTEDWTGTLAAHCPRCAAAVEHAHEGRWAIERNLGIAAEQDPGPALDAWLEGAADGRRITALAEG